MSLFERKLGVVLVAVLAVSSVAIAESAGPPLVNWSAPPTYTTAGKRLMSGELGLGPLPFFPIAPCRQYNSSGTPLSSGVDRTITLTGAPCGIPAGTLAVSVNITIFAITGATGNGVVKIGTAAAPTTGWINYPATETQRANAGAVPLSASGQIVLQVAQGAGTANIIVDVNGYYYTGSVGNVMPSGDAFFIRGVLSGSGVLYGQNQEATGANSYGVLGATSSSGAGSAGVEGEATNATGAIYGVRGLVTASNTTGGSAGVYGKDGTGSVVASNNLTAGVSGVSKLSIGVNGISENAGVRGQVYFSDGTFEAQAYLGLASGGLYYGVWADGSIHATGAITGATKSFIQPHPTDAGKEINYISLEGRASEIYTRGTIDVRQGTNHIEVPDDFRLVARTGSYSAIVTPVGAMASVAVLSQDENGIEVQASRNARINYVIYAERAAFAGHAPVQDNVHFVPQGPSGFSGPLPASYKQMLIENGTLNSDGTTNMKTAERAGWVKIWEARKPEIERARDLSPSRASDSPQ
jgi:hypothetical protein